MLDIKYIRENQELVALAAKNKNIELDLQSLLQLDGKASELKKELDNLRSLRNSNVESIKNSGGKPTQEQITAGKGIKDEIAALESSLRPIQEQLLELMYQVPNIPETEVPVGASEVDNVVVAEFGEKPQFDFTPKNHWEIAQDKDWIDKERAAKVAGARFAYIKGGMFDLQFALVNFVKDRLTSQTWIKQIIKNEGLQNISDKPFMPIIPPMMVQTEPFKKTARLSKEEQTYQLEGEELWMNASAEHSVCPMYMDEVLEEQDLPIRYLAYATSFRKEAGTYGKDTEGIFRTHQFDKLEMEAFSTPETSKAEHNLLIGIQKALLLELGLHFKYIEKCTADIGTPNAKGVDLNTWLPGQDAYRETSTADLMNDFQARRLNTRVKRSNGDLEFVHTNDATAIVLSRIPVAILENYQTAEGDVMVPDALKPYLGNRELL